MDIKKLLESTGFTTKMKKGTTYGFWFTFYIYG
jgi:hypothetical protein